MSRIAQALQRLFQRHRIVFWYDVKEELRQEFEAVTLPGVETIVLDNNALGVKSTSCGNSPSRSFCSIMKVPRRRHLEAVERSADVTRRDRTQALKGIDTIDKILNELREYEDEILYPLAGEQVEIDLDDGVAVNYPKFGKALEQVRGLS